jgi:hypothetical protein
MAYTDEHTRALAMVTEKGAAATFSKTVTPQNDTTGAAGTPVTTTWVGVAIERVDGSSRQYRDPTLADTRTLTLFYVPTTAGDIPAEDAGITWNGQALRVRRVPKRINLDGAGAIAAYVECALA